MLESPAPLVTVVTPTHNRRERLLRTLAALEAQALDHGRFEVVVIDDGSSDDTRAALADLLARTTLNLRVLEQQPAQGAAAARNRGWRVARGRLIAFTDDDCEPRPEWLSALLAAAEAHPGAIIQGRTLPNPAEADRLGPFARTLEVTRLSAHYETANILYPRELLERLDGFDQGFTMPAGEDTDLGWRARAAGAEAYFVPEALVYHAVHQKGPKQTLRDAFRASDAVRPYRDHPELRAHLDKGIFFHPSHPLLAQAVLAGWIARKNPAAAAFALPYAVHLARRARAARAGLHYVPFYALRDTVEVVATLRGAVRHRAPVL